MADAQDMVFGSEPDSIQMTPDQIAASSEIDPITEAIRKEVLAKQEEIMRRALLESNIDEEEKKALENKNAAELNAYLREEADKAKIREVLANEDVQGQLNEVEVEGYKKVHEQFKDSYYDISWDGQAKEGTRTQEIKRADGSVVASLTETTYATKPVTVELSNGDKQEISSYRTVDFPRKLDNGGPLHISMAVKDPSGKNISEENALYFSAHYSKEGKLMEISSPQPIKFAGDGDNAIGYIERNGQIYTLAVTQGQYNAMAKEVQQNKGMAVNISQQAEKQAPDIAQTQQQDLPSQNLSRQNQDVTPQAGQEQANEADKPELTRQNANPNFPKPPAPEANNEPQQGQGQEQKEKEKEQREKEREKQEEQEKEKQEEEKKKQEEKEEEEGKSTKKPKKGKNKTRLGKGGKASKAENEEKSKEQQDAGGLVGDVMRKAGVKVDKTDEKLIQQIQSNSTQQERDEIIEAIIENRPTKEYDALKKHESELKDAAQEVVINARQQPPQAAAPHASEKTNDSLIDRPPGLMTPQEENEAASVNAQSPRTENEQEQAASQTQEAQQSQETQQQDAPPPPPPGPPPNLTSSSADAESNTLPTAGQSPDESSSSDPEPPSGRDELLNAIKQGKELRKVDLESQGKFDAEVANNPLAAAVDAAKPKEESQKNTNNVYADMDDTDKAIQALTDTIKKGDLDSVTKDLKNINENEWIKDEINYKKAYDAAKEYASQQTEPEAREKIASAAAIIADKAGVEHSPESFAAVEKTNTEKEKQTDKKEPEQESTSKTSELKAPTPTKEGDLNKTLTGSLGKRRGGIAGEQLENPYEGLSVEKAVDKLTETIKTGDSKAVEKAMSDINKDDNLAFDMDQKHYKKAYEAGMDHARDGKPENRRNVQAAALKVAKEAGTEASHSGRVQKDAQANSKNQDKGR